MLTNLLRPWILSRVLGGVAVALLIAFALRTAWRVLRHYRVGESTEGQLALERRAELVATIVQAALLMSLLDLGLTLLGADRSSDSIRGAMCAYGVFGSTPGGFTALSSSALSAAACALWLVLHRLDLRLERPSLTRHKFIALFAVAPLAFLDLGATLFFVLSLDFSMVASCCSLSLDGGLPVGDAGIAGPRTLAFFVFIAAGSSASLSALFARHRPGRVSVALASSLSLVAAATALPAILWYVAPHVYETPHHLCPFCLLRADVFGIGWPLFGAVFAGLVLGLSIALVESTRGLIDEPAEVDRMQRKLGGWGALSWFLAVSLCILPVARFAWITSGASLFGTP